MDIGKRINELLNQSGKTSTDLAQYLGLTRSAVYKIIGRPNIDTALLEKISGFLNVEMSSFFSDITTHNQDYADLIHFLKMDAASENPLGNLEAFFWKTLSTTLTKSKDLKKFFTETLEKETFLSLLRETVYKDSTPKGKTKDPRIEHTYQELIKWKDFSIQNMAMLTILVDGMQLQTKEALSPVFSELRKDFYESVLSNPGINILIKEEVYTKEELHWMISDFFLMGGMPRAYGAKPNYLKKQ